MASNEKNTKRRVGIIGFGKLGQYLINAVQESDQLELAFVWCRREEVLRGPVRGLCDKAPNNVNTMATAAIAAHNLGFDKVQGCLVSDTRMKNWHIVKVEVTGPTDCNTGNVFHVSTKRKNPAEIGAVTGKATYASFVSSMMGAKGLGAGVHLC